jgi:hypothetical protein
MRTGLGRTGLHSHDHSAYRLAVEKFVHENFVHGSMQAGSGAVVGCLQEQVEAVKERLLIMK